MVPFQPFYVCLISIGGFLCSEILILEKRWSYYKLISKCNFQCSFDGIIELLQYIWFLKDTLNIEGYIVGYIITLKVELLSVITDTQ